LDRVECKTAPHLAASPVKSPEKTALLRAETLAPPVQSRSVVRQQTRRRTKMIRNLMLAVGLFTLTGASAMAAPVSHTRTSTHRVARAEEPAPAGDAAKEPKKAKKAKKSKKAKDDKAAEGAAPAPAPAPAK
jgi:hypothetical protein